MNDKPTQAPEQPAREAGKQAPGDVMDRYNSLAWLSPEPCKEPEDGSKAAADASAVEALMRYYNW